MLKLKLRGKNRGIDLKDSDFITAGGQGKIYNFGSTVCKIYIDPQKMIPYAKFTELQKLKRTNIIKPLDVLLDSNNIPVGFTMAKVFGEPLCKFFISDFRDSCGVGDKHIHKYINIIQETISSIHTAKCLMIDGNELSYIVSKTLDNVFFIDVDSYQTPNFPATAIMQSIKDYHSSTFSEITDWFSYAIVVCWLLVGVHPFKGKHPNFKKKGVENLIDRMKSNVSIFNKDVKIPSNSRSLNCIPSNYKTWFIDTFEKGRRTYPPGLLGKVTMTPVYTSIIRSTGNFDMIHLKDFKKDIILYKKYFGEEMVLLKSDNNSNDPNYYLYNNRRMQKPLDNDQLGNDKMLLTPTNLFPVLISQSKSDYPELDIFKFYGIDQNHKISGNKIGSDAFILENTMYIKIDKMFEEICFKEFSNGNIIPTIHNQWNILSHSSRMFDGFLIQEGLKKVYVYIPVPSKHQCLIKQISVLEGYRIINGKYDNGVCMIVGRKGSIYDRIILRFAEDGTYDCRVINDISYNSINFAVLDNGICASFMDDHTLELFHNKPNMPDIKSITDPGINSSMKLWKDGTRLLFSKNSNLYILKMKRR